MPLSLFSQPVLFILAILVAKRAFTDYGTIKELLDLVPPDGEMYPLRGSKSMADLPFFESMSAKALPGKIENASTFSNRFRGLDSRSGYPQPPTVHDFRAKGLYLVGMYINSAYYCSH